MKLVIGGAWQQKTETACRYFQIGKESLADGRTCDPEEIFACPGIHHFHLYVKRMMEQERSLAEFAEKLEQRNPDILLISDEIGYGLVPLDAFERAWREQTGRICCDIAGRAETVIRVVAGIPQVIKGE